MSAEPIIAIETERLQLRQFTHDDDEFILTLLNDADWKRFIGDRGVRTLAQAHTYIDGLIEMYERHGYGLWLMVRRADGASTGMCGLIRRESLIDPDIGFAVLPGFRKHGYTAEAAAATLRYANEVAGLRRVVAITTADNASSIEVLRRLGLRFEKTVLLPPVVDELNLYAIEWAE
jgi:RimJ/RimL family protein N-acetyltransferase